MPAVAGSLSKHFKLSRPALRAAPTVQAPADGGDRQAPVPEAAQGKTITVVPGPHIETHVSGAMKKYKDDDGTEARQYAPPPEPVGE